MPTKYTRWSVVYCHKNCSVTFSTSSCSSGFTSASSVYSGAIQSPIVKLGSNMHHSMPFISTCKLLNSLWKGIRNVNRHVTILLSQCFHSASLAQYSRGIPVSSFLWAWLWWNLAAVSLGKTNSWMRTLGDATQAFWNWKPWACTLTYMWAWHGMAPAPTEWMGDFPCSASRVTFVIYFYICCNLLIVPTAQTWCCLSQIGICWDSSLPSASLPSCSRLE